VVFGAQPTQAGLEDIVFEAFGRCATRWQKVSGHDDPEGWVRSFRGCG
jgi:hypothetical protein